ncbi:MAG: hypothetical protein KDI67_13710, partial [Gammaproteobacteria bacterium]|nr:hypothetical protein [Gammaproteobacteria bacterium]
MSLPSSIGAGHCAVFWPGIFSSLIPYVVATFAVFFSHIGMTNAAQQASTADHSKFEQLQGPFENG